MARPYPARPGAVLRNETGRLGPVGQRSRQEGWELGQRRGSGQGRRRHVPGFGQGGLRPGAGLRSGAAPAMGRPAAAQPSTPPSRSATRVKPRRRREAAAKARRVALVAHRHHGLVEGLHRGVGVTRVEVAAPFQNDQRDADRAGDHAGPPPVVPVARCRSPAGVRSARARHRPRPPGRRPVPEGLNRTRPARASARMSSTVVRPSARRSNSRPGPVGSRSPAALR